MKKAIIIGATSGIGHQVALRLLDDGYRVALAGRRVELLTHLVERYGAERVIVTAMDITLDKATTTLDALLDNLDTPDLLLVASGIGYQNHTLDEERELRTIATNCEGMTRIVTHFINYVKRNADYNHRHRAHIAVITSVAGTMPLGTAPAYSASKRMQSHYLSALRQLCRMERIPVDISDIRPGFVATDILDNTKHYPMMMSREQAARHILRGIVRRRRIITFDWRYRLIVALWRLIPLWLWERLTFIRN